MSMASDSDRVGLEGFVAKGARSAPGSAIHEVDVPSEGEAACAVQCAIEGLALLLASGASDHMTGTVMPIDSETTAGA